MAEPSLPSRSSPICEGSSITPPPQAATSQATLQTERVVDPTDFARHPRKSVCWPEDDAKRKDSGVDIPHDDTLPVKVHATRCARPPPCRDPLTYHASLKRARTLDDLHPKQPVSHIINVHDRHHHLLHVEKVPFFRRRSVKWIMTVIMFLLLVAIATFVGLVIKYRKSGP
ncbi:hypothetical protein DFJ77DRAFT_548948 [Powellomyces hirtus]|nr:hypothetical protein DFJ77DRAFT_548948 [Powellomyces hirtus]